MEQQFKVGDISITVEDQAWSASRPGDTLALYVCLNGDDEYYIKVIYKDMYNCVELNGYPDHVISDGLVFDFTTDEDVDYRVESSDLLSYLVDIDEEESDTVTELEVCDYSFKPGIISTRSGDFIYKIVDDEHIFEYPGAVFNANKLYLEVAGERYNVRDMIAGRR